MSMTPTDLAMCALALLDRQDVLSQEGAEVRSQIIGAACEDRGADCPIVLAVLWGMETAGTYSLTPRSRGSCGVGQVVPTKNTPTCKAMQDPIVGLRAAWYVWGVKVATTRTLEGAFRAYNGHPKHKERYGKKAAKRCKAVMQHCTGATRPSGG